MGRPADPPGERPAADLDRSELEALLATRRELGEQYDAELVAAFADRIEAAVEARGAGGVDHARADARADAREERHDRMLERASQRQLTLGIVSLGTGIPLTGAAAAIADVPGLAVVWLGIAAVNAAHASAVANLRRRRDRRD